MPSKRTIAHQKQPTHERKVLSLSEIATDIFTASISSSEGPQKQPYAVYIDARDKNNYFCKCTCLAYTQGHHICSHINLASDTVWELEQDRRAQEWAAYMHRKGLYESDYRWGDIEL